MIPAPVEAAKNTKSAAAESKLKRKGVFRTFAESPFFVFLFGRNSGVRRAEKALMIR